MSRIFNFACIHTEIQVSPSLGTFSNTHISKQHIRFGIRNAKEFMMLFCVALVIILGIHCSGCSKSEGISCDLIHIFTENMKIVPFIHQTCRNTIYPRSNVTRFTVPDHLVKWADEYADYSPVFYESSHITGAVWADPPIGKHTFF